MAPRQLEGAYFAPSLVPVRRVVPATSDSEKIASTRSLETSSPVSASTSCILMPMPGLRLTLV